MNTRHFWLFLFAGLPGVLFGLETPKIRIIAEGFNASEQNIHAVLNSAVGEMWRYFPDHKIEPIVVVKGDGDPSVRYQRNEHGEIVMELNTGGFFWSQYSYQFAHEFAHILSGFRDGNPQNLWFEETLCEAAALFVLGRMADSWQTNPPYENWRSYGPAFRDYVESIRLDRLPLSGEIRSKGLPAFYKKHATVLSNDPRRRDLNGAMALEILPLFEETPQNWESIRWLNSTRPKEDWSFSDYLLAWKSAAPERHHRFIQKLSAKFGFRPR